MKLFFYGSGSTDLSSDSFRFESDGDNKYFFIFSFLLGYHIHAVVFCLQTADRHADDGIYTDASPEVSHSIFWPEKKQPSNARGSTTVCAEGSTMFFKL